MTLGRFCVMVGSVVTGVALGVGMGLSPVASGVLAGGIHTLAFGIVWAVAEERE